MPSFDVVSELDWHEVNNAIDQANREVSTRFDFKGSDAKFTLESETLVLQAQADFQLKQMQDILHTKLAKRQVDLKHLTYKDPEIQAKTAKQEANFQQGLKQESAKKIVKIIKETKIKVQTAIQGDHIRVTGKKRDDLQDVISVLRDADSDLPLQYVNFRD